MICFSNFPVERAVLEAGEDRVHLRQRHALRQLQPFRQQPTLIAIHIESLDASIEASFGSARLERPRAYAFAGRVSRCVR